MKEMHDNKENLEKIVSKLKEQGIDAGEAEKQRIIEEAKKQAEEIISEANAQKQTIIDEANAKAEQAEKNAQMALQQASRDMVEATKVAVLKYMESVFGDLSESLFTQEQYLQELTKAVVASIEGNKTVSVPADTQKAMEAFIAKVGLKEQVELQPLANNEAKIVVQSKENSGVQFVLSDSDIKQAMFTLLNKDLVERITQNQEA
jgi:V/A-type H+-transporting ATPase subunit E